MAKSTMAEVLVCFKESTVNRIAKRVTRESGSLNMTAGTHSKIRRYWNVNVVPARELLSAGRFLLNGHGRGNSCLSYLSRIAFWVGEWLLA